MLNYILTGSSNPEEAAKIHAGAGRFTILDMRTMSLQELGFSTRKISLAALLKAGKLIFMIALQNWSLLLKG